MTHRFAGAIVLAVLALFLFVIARMAWFRWRKTVRARLPRGRDLAPKHIQERRKVMAALRRVMRGLRFPSNAEKIDHRRFLKLLEKQQRATGHQKYNQLRKLVRETGLVALEG